MEKNKSGKKSTLTTVQAKHIVARLQNIRWRKCNRIEEEAKNQYAKYRWKKLKHRIEQIRNGTAKVKEKFLFFDEKECDRYLIHDTLENIFDFDTEAMSDLESMRREIKRKEEEAKERLNQMCSAYVDEAILGTPEQALAVIEQFENFRP